MEMGVCLEIQNPPGEEMKALRPGKACGRLTGGNLSLIAAGMGTPWQINAKDCVLYLEDVGEGVYSLDKMLRQLQYGGILDAAAGLVFGAFTNCTNAYRADYGPEDLLQDFFSNWPKPVLYNLRSAHCTPMVTLPLGTCCAIDGCAGTVSCHC